MKNKFYKLIIPIILILSLTNILEAKKRINIFTGEEVPLSAKVNAGFTVTTENKDIKLAEAKSSFDCETGAIKMDASVIEDLNTMMKTFGEDAEVAVENLLKEMATQAGIELSLEIMARLHYMLIQAMSSGESIFIALQMEDAVKCFTSGFFDAIEGELEAGIGSNIYDILTGKIGINFVSIASIYPCVKEALGTPKDEEAKKRLNESRQWVRFMFYKLLNSSFDTLFNLQLSAGEIDAKCKEVKMQLKNGDFPVSMAQLGAIITPVGTKINTVIDVEEPKTVGLRIPPSEDTSKDMKNQEATKAAGGLNKTDQEIKKASDKQDAIDADNSLTDSEKAGYKKTLELKKASVKKYIEEVRISSAIITNENLNIIDMTDLKPAEVRQFNNNIYEKVVYILKRKKTVYAKNIEDSFFQILKRIFTMTTHNKSMIDLKKKMFELKDENSTMSPKPFIYTKNSTMEEVLKSKYYGELRKKAIYFENMKFGNLSEREKFEIQTEIFQQLPKTDRIYEDLINMSYYKSVLNKMRKWEKIKHYIASGEPIFTDGGGETVVLDPNEINKIIYNEFQYDLQQMRNDTTKGNPDTTITTRVNQNIVLRKPLHELEYLRLLYEAESRDVLLQIMKTDPGTEIGRLILSNNIGDMVIDQPQLIEYTIPKIRLIKEMYAIELLDTYSSRAEAMNVWVMENFQNSEINDTITSFFETEIAKFQYKMKQKRLLIKLMLEKDVK